jgi:hypothetical protein
MKPERIQFAPTTSGPSTGIFQIFRFASFRKAVSFSDFVSEMADNHGRQASCSIDSHVNELVVLVPADDVGEVDEPGDVETVGETDGARLFVQEVADIYELWSSPAKES